MVVVSALFYASLLDKRFILQHICSKLGL